MRRVMKLAAGALAASLVLAGCGGEEDGTGGAEPSPTSGDGAASEVKVGLAYDIGGRGDQSFNDAAARGLDQAVDELGIETPRELEASPGETDAQKEERLRLLAQGGFDPIIAVGFAYAAPVKKVAEEFPDASFAIVDDASFELPNVANLVFAENEGSFLVGAAAALKSETGTIGFVGGVNVPLIQKFQAGYEAGAKAADPQVEVLSTYLTQPPDFTGFNDPAKGKTAAEGMFDRGADVVYHAAGGSGSGVFEAAAAAEGWAIGVDSDQYLTAADDLKPVILTSMIKKVDTAVFEYISSTVEGEPLSGVQLFDLERDGVGYSTSNEEAIADLTDQLDEYRQQIIDGEITVPEEL